MKGAFAFQQYQSTVKSMLSALTLFKYLIHRRNHGALLPVEVLTSHLTAMAKLQGGFIKVLRVCTREKYTHSEVSLPIVLTCFMFSILQPILGVNPRHPARLHHVKMCYPQLLTVKFMQSVVIRIRCMAHQLKFSIRRRTHGAHRR